MARSSCSAGSRRHRHSLENFPTGHFATGHMRWWCDVDGLVAPSPAVPTAEGSARYPIVHVCGLDPHLTTSKILSIALAPNGHVVDTARTFSHLYVELIAGFVWMSAADARSCCAGLRRLLILARCLPFS